jgi:predicted ABC-type ATPase
MHGRTFVDGHEGSKREDALSTPRKATEAPRSLGGHTITGLLLKAANVGLPVRVVYIGLESADLHVHRVRARVRQGGHDIPEERIRQRYTNSRANLIRLMPHVAEVRIFDNTREMDTVAGDRPEPKPILHLKAGRLPYLCPLSDVPTWAKPSVQAALETVR